MLTTSQATENMNTEYFPKASDDDTSNLTLSKQFDASNKRDPEEMSKIAENEVYMAISYLKTTNTGRMYMRRTQNKLKIGKM